MFRVDWTNPKTTISAVEELVSANLGEIYDGLIVENGFMYVITTTPMSSEQEDIVKDLIYSLNETPMEVVTQADKSAPKDSDGSPLQRIKITTTGWHYQLHGVEFETSKLDSVYSKKVDGTNYGFSTMKFYKDVSGVETEITGEDLNQAYLDANCIKTVMDWEATHDLEIIGGFLKQSGVPTDDIRLWVVGVPDVPEAYGGSKPFVVNVNLKYVGLEEGVRVDGRAPKYMAYSDTYHTNKVRMMFRHDAGTKHKLHMIFELFKA